MEDILTKRIFLKADAEEIKALQKDAPEFNKHYPKHNEWLNMAMKEIVAGRRFAFGAYKTSFDTNGSSIVSLVGSIILKKETYSHIMQLKNLYITNFARNRGVGTKLFNAIEEFCIKRGTVGIDTEVPYEEGDTINFLNKRGFVVQNLFESPYKKEEKIYRMYKRLPNKYTGDPFDLFHLSSWLFETLYDFRIVDRKEPTLRFVSEPKFDFETTKSSEATQIRGSAVVLNDKAVSSKVTDFHNKNKEHLLAVIAPEFEESAKRFCEKHRILTLDRVTVERELNEALAIEIPPFKREAINGMIVRMNSKYFEGLKGSKEHRTYFKGGPIGKYLKKGDLILFFVEQSPNFADGGVWAYSELETCEIGSPNEIWEKYENKNPIFPKNEYFAWCFDKAEIVALSFSEAVLIEPISYLKIREDITEMALDREQLGHFYLSASEVSKFLKKSKINETNANQIPTTKNGGTQDKMDPIAIITAITAGLNLIDKFRDLTLKILKKENTPALVEARQEGDRLQIIRNGQVAEEIPASDLRQNAWDQSRYNALQKKIKLNWDKYNMLEGDSALLSIDEKARIKLQMNDIREELCKDFREMIQIYERTLNITLSDHYLLPSICSES